jgi:hypothetical protein
VLMCEAKDTEPMRTMPACILGAAAHGRAVFSTEPFISIAGIVRLRAFNAAGPHVLRIDDVGGRSLPAGIV